MPTKRVRTNRNLIVTEMSSSEREGLLNGHFWCAEPPKERQAELWQEHAAELVEFWTSDPAEWSRAGNKRGFGAPPPAGLFRRPAAWWKFSEHRRQRILGSPGPWDDDELHFGVPRFGCDEDRFEGEKGFLIRNAALLLPAEKEALKAEGNPAVLKAALRPTTIQ